MRHAFWPMSPVTGRLRFFLRGCETTPRVAWSIAAIRANRNDPEQQRRMGSGQQDTQRKSTTSPDPGSDNQQTRNTGSSGRPDYNDR
jgi:hypothetical protein